MVDWFSITVLSLLGTWALVVGTLVLMYWQTRTTQNLNSANAVMQLRERFDGARMRAARRHLSERLLRQEHEDIASMEVVTFFELVGTLTHRKLLDPELVWEAFGTWVAAYYWAVRHPVDLVERLRTDLHDPLIYHEFEWLSEKMGSIDVHRLGPNVSPASDPAVDASRVLEKEEKLGAI